MSDLIWYIITEKNNKNKHKCLNLYHNHIMHEILNSSMQWSWLYHIASNEKK